MEMIIGGAFQGKRAYADKIFPQKKTVDGSSASLAELFEAEVIDHFHEFIRKELWENREVSGLAQELFQKNPEAVVITDELGYGVVPVDPFDRQYRETVGRVCTELARYSSKVTRVICGIGTVIKDEGNQ